MTTYRDAESFAARLDAMGADPRRNLSGPWWTARCIHPDHTDDTPSMTFKDGDTALVVHCFACSPNGHKADWLRAVMAAAEHGDPLPPAAPSKRRSGGGGGARGARVAAYDYTDPQGRPVARKVRYEPKTFAWERPYGEHWSEGLAGTPLEDLPLYGLRSLAGAEPGAMVAWCEGEKDTDRLAAEAGIPAVCSAASGTWPRDLSPLTGMHVQIVADNDAAGIRHALGTGDRLAGIAASITYWAGAVRGKGADLSDHFDAGHGLGDLIELHRDGDRLTPIQGTPADAAKEGFGGYGGVGGAQEWPDPVPFIRNPPDSGLPEPLAETLPGRVAAMIAARWGVPHLLPLDVFAGVAMAATNGNYRVAKSAATSFPLAGYLMVMASPGSLKSPVLSAAAEPLAQAQAEESDERAGTVAAARAKHQALASALKKRTDDLGKALGKRDTAAARDAEADIEALGQQIRAAEAGCAGVETLTLGADMTYEALIAKAAGNGGRAALLSAEGGLIENLMGRYSDGQARTEFLNQAHDGERYSGERVGDGARIIGRPWACILQVVQPGVADALLGNGHATERGFASRFWYAAVPDAPYRNRLDLPDLDPDLLAEWAGTVRRIRKGSGRTLTLSDGARAALLACESARIAPLAAQHADNGPLSGWLGKAVMTGMRWAAVLQLLTDPESSVITEESMRAAVGFLDLHASHAVWMFAQSRGSLAKSPRARVLGWLATTGPNTPITPNTRPNPEESGGIGGYGGVVATRDVWQRFRDQSWCRSTDDARAVLSDLAALGWIDGPIRQTTDRGGRPSEVWATHPRIAHHYRLMTEGNPR